ncbi:hypothetical protein LUD75_01470 [Epilithonimonas sp. JDS]|uniref:surface-adhesin E family protein n=1 Tax=Epilithonimonas sp. JDS TaxID=2902797 RepID=UPI001E422FCB|nr:surface-adhesin E family protein [Epilithonimonas sp. JDS]MCD9853357.1 hypothetical protein [Epilithonimonas sp. JDS]
MDKLLLASSLFIFSFSYAQEWKYIFENDTDTFYYMPNTENTAWIKVVSGKTEYHPKSSTGLKVIDGYVLTLWKFDCDNRKAGLVQWKVYSKEDSLLNSLVQNKHLTEMAYVIPDSVGEGFLGVFCNNDYK